MSNHVHLLLTPKRAAAIPKLIISLGRRYVYINRQHRRTGTLWESRYKSSLVEAKTYLLTCMRYIELNPVRAAMVDDPAHYRWTSYRANALGQTRRCSSLIPSIWHWGRPTTHGEWLTAVCSGTISMTRPSAPYDSR